MTIETSLSACEEQVRHADPDRYLSALFAPAERRPLLFALYAFNHELARIGETVKEPNLAAIRFEWWREAVADAQEGRPRAHDVVRGLAEMFARCGPPLELFEVLIDARRFDAGSESFAQLADLEAYGDATAGSVMRIAAHLLDEHIPDDGLFRHAGTAFALTGVLRTLPFKSGREKQFLPRTLCSVAGPHLAFVVGKILERARAHYSAARARPKPGRAFPAVLPAALVPLYSRSLLRASDETLRRPIEIPLYRRQWALFRASIRGRV